MQRRIAATVLVAVGILLIAGTFAFRMYSRAPAYERLTNDFSRSLTPQAIAALKTDVANLRAASDEFSAKALPTLARLLHVTPTQLAQIARTRFPSVASAPGRLPQTVASFERLVRIVEAQEPRMRLARAIPTRSIATSVLPWLILVAGIIAISIGNLMALRGAPAAAIALGVLLLVGVFAFSLPTKTRAADAMNKDLKPVYTSSQLVAARADMASVTALSGELVNQVLPAIAQANRVPASQLQGAFIAQFPALSRALVALPEASERFDAAIAVFERNLSDFEAVKSVPFQALTWALVAAGALGLLAGTGALMSGWQEGGTIREAHERRRLHRAA